jgi:hypothetical protein
MCSYLSSMCGRGTGSARAPKQRAARGRIILEEEEEEEAGTVMVGGRNTIYI